MRIALSGLSGAGSTTTAKLVSERLALPMSNVTFRDLAKERGVDFRDLQAQAEYDTSIDFELDRRLIRYIEEHTDCLIATDLACWLDSRSLQKVLGVDSNVHFDYKIWLNVPLEERARRIHSREEGELQDVLEYNDTRDKMNRERYLSLYGVDIFNHDDIDWIFATGSLNLHQVVDAICTKIETLR